MINYHTLDLKEFRNSVYELDPLVLKLPVTEITIRNRIQEYGKKLPQNNSIALF
jgi:hypothetical protein